MKTFCPLKDDELGDSARMSVERLHNFTKVVFVEQSFSSVLASFFFINAYMNSSIQFNKSDLCCMNDVIFTNSSSYSAVSI